LRTFGRTHGEQKSAKVQVSTRTSSQPPLCPSHSVPAAPRVSCCRPPISPAQTPALRLGRREESNPDPHLWPLLLSLSLVTLPRYHVPNVTPAPLDMPTSRQSHTLSLPQPTCTVSWPPETILLAPSPVYKKPPFFPKKIHAITRNLPDILSSSLSSYFELAGNVVLAGHRPGHRAFPAIPCLPRRAACWRWPRRTPTAALHPLRRSPSPLVSLPVAATLPGSLSRSRPSRARKKALGRWIDQVLIQRPRLSSTPSPF
jgi:hypothetical protein